MLRSMGIPYRLLGRIFWIQISVSANQEVEQENADYVKAVMQIRLIAEQKQAEVMLSCFAKFVKKRGVNLFLAFFSVGLGPVELQIPLRPSFRSVSEVP